LSQRPEVTPDRRLDLAIARYLLPSEQTDSGCGARDLGLITLKELQEFRSRHAESCTEPHRGDLTPPRREVRRVPSDPQDVGRLLNRDGGHPTKVIKCQVLHARAVVSHALRTGSQEVCVEPDRIAFSRADVCALGTTFTDAFAIKSEMQKKFNTLVLEVRRAQPLDWSR
jgi:hypothetical protein